MWTFIKVAFISAFLSGSLTGCSMLNRFSEKDAVENLEYEQQMESLREKLKDQNNMIADLQEENQILKTQDRKPAKQDMGVSFGVTKPKDDFLDLDDDFSSDFNVSSNSTTSNDRLSDNLEDRNSMNATNRKEITDKNLYKKIITAYKAKQFSLVQDFTKRLDHFYPQSPFTAGGLYWSGAAYYQKRKYARALKAYDKILNRFPNNIKAPNAYMGKALVYEKLSLAPMARRLINQVKIKFEGTDFQEKAEKLEKRILGK